MRTKKLSLKEVEGLSYYDFMSYMGASFFQLGGPRSMDGLAELCGVGPNKKVLVVGCGSGFIACRIAKGLGASVTGVDISGISIEKAKERAKKEGLMDMAEFKVGDAYELPFEDGTFDAVITGFVSMFLDMDRALKEFSRVAKPGGFIGINEMYKEGQIPEKEEREISDVEAMLRYLTKLPFRLNTPEEWKAHFERAGLKNIQVQKHQDYMGLKDAPLIIKEMGGQGELLKTLWRMIKYYFSSKKIRERVNGLSRVKKVFLQKKSTARHVGYILGAGEKP